MLSFESPISKVMLYAKARMHNCFNRVSRRIDAFLFSEDQEGSECSSDRIFCFLNLIFLASLILLSPDKVTEVLPSARPNWLAFDWIQDAIKTLGRLAPF